jgi:hypothetical protein
VELEPEPEPVEVEPPPTVRYVCTCGRRLKSMLENSGAEIECPACGRSLIVPDFDADVPPLPPELSNPWFDPFLGQTVTPWRADLDPARPKR